MAYYPSENVSIEEMVIGWKGRFKYKQFNTAKPNKYDIEMHLKETEYVYNLLVYFDAITSYDPHLNPSSSQNENVLIFT